MSIRVQQRFCREHHLQAARLRWEELHPNNIEAINIDWTQLETRLQRLRSEMLWLIERPDQSFYRAEFERSIVDTGGSRTMMKHVIGTSRRTQGQKPEDIETKQLPETNAASISVGYYGTRGLTVM
jgi:hypothetical protein